MIFDGKGFADKIEAELKVKFANLPKEPKLAVWLDPDNASGAKYVQKKMEMAKRLGVEVILNKVDGDEDGVMVQMPHPNAKVLIDQIDPKKDVDGLREDSPFMPATVRAVCEILNFATSPLPSPKFWRGGSAAVEGEVFVVGSKGVVGQKLLKYLPGAMGMDKEDFNPSALLRADVVISATGQPSLIKPEMIKEGAICIDIGYPEGDFDPSVALRASFFTPVPGGVGPVTVVMLFANLLETVL